MAGLFNGHLLEFPRIRVDSFTPPPPAHGQGWMLPDPIHPHSPPSKAPNAQLYLLTHVHSDHLIGLTSQFTGKIVCSPDTKRMLLRLESEMDRDHYQNGAREVKRRKYEGLCARNGVDYIETLNPGETKVYMIPDAVSVTLMDANHCPGSSMFLVADQTKAILHTGDVRADLTFRQALRRSPFLQEFFPPSSSSAPTPATAQSATRRLNRIYLDTSAFLGTGDMPGKSVLEALVTQMSVYPEDTVFFLNAWCFGWEDVVKEVARYFGQRVHVDRYKRSIYGAVQSDPFLLRCTTDAPTATRFHACDRYNRCEVARDKGVVQVVMCEVKSAAWELQNQQFLRELNDAALGEGDWPMTIQVPIARHSPLPELQELVKLFKPAAVSPNTLIPHHKGLDFFVFADLLKTAISSDAYEKMIDERDQYFAASPRFGRAWLSQGHSMQSQISALVLSGSWETVPLLPPRLVGGTQGPLSDSRDAWGNDQLRRVAGWGPELDEDRAWGTGTRDPQKVLPSNTRAARLLLKVARRTRSSSNPTPTSSIKAKTQQPPQQLAKHIPIGVRPTVASSTSPPASSRSAGPSSATHHTPNQQNIPIQTRATSDPSPSVGDEVVLTIIEKPDASSSREEGRVNIKQEPLPTIKPELSLRSPPCRSRGLKRERRQSNYRVNIAHLSDLAGSQQN